MGVAAVGHRRKLLAAIEALRGSATSAARSADLGSEVPSAEAPPGAGETGHGAEGHGAERRQLTVLFCDLAGNGIRLIDSAGFGIPGWPRGR